MRATAEQRALVNRVRYRPGWAFKIAGPFDTCLCVFAETPDSNDPSRARRTQHQFEIPDGMDADTRMIRWIFDCLLLCEQHEAGEFYRVDDSRPFLPYHQDEGSPYVIVDRRTEH